MLVSALKPRIQADADEPDAPPEELNSMLGPIATVPDAVRPLETPRAAIVWFPFDR